MNLRGVSQNPSFLRDNCILGGGTPDGSVHIDYPD